MEGILASYRYARALNECIENDQHIENVLNSLRTVLELIETNEIVEKTLKNPAITPEVRESVLRAFVDKLNLPTEAASFLLLLFKRHRLELLPYAIEQLSEMVDERLKRITAEIRTAQTLSENEKARIQKSLETFSNKTVTLNVREAPELLGGVVARMGTTMIDGSLQTRLERLKEALLAEETM
jgi:F-type H+-transporting ATPase subunit delta